MEKLHKKILVVDNEAETLLYLEKLLERSGYQVKATTRGKEAVELAGQFLPDLILLDIVMPDISGNDVAFTLANNPATAEIPIIFLTGILSKEEELTANKSGRYFLMAKPVSGEKLLEKAEEILSS